MRERVGAVAGRWRALRELLRAGLWAVPGGCVVVALLLALLLVEVDRRLQSEVAFTFGAGPDGAREVLSAITTAMITFTGLVFSITVVVLQLTSSQFSPRVLRTFLRDRLTQYALGVFTATFVYAVMVLRTVSSGDDDEFVPAVATSAALAMLLLSVVLFVAYIHHIATSMQASSILAAIGDETRSALDRRFPHGEDGPPTAPVLPPADLVSTVLPAPRLGVVTTVDEARLVRLAADADVVLRTTVRTGEFAPQGAPLVEVLGDPSALDLGAVLACLEQGQDRTLQQDVGFGFRQLCDVAERALSPGINDPTTAVQALDQLHDLLRRLATRNLRTGVLTDDAGQVRLVVPPDRLEDYLLLALDGIDQYGRSSRPVQQRIDALLADVASAALPQHRAAVERCRAAREVLTGRGPRASWALPGDAVGCAALSKWKGVVDVYARATTVRARPSALDDAIAMMRDDVMDDVTRMDGNIGLSMLADRESGRCIVTSAWTDQEAMRRSAAAVKPLRDRMSEMMGDTPTVQEWEIAVLHRRRPTDAGACARVTWLQGQSGDADRAVEVYRQKVLPALEDVDGFCSASLLVDRDTGRAVSTVTFESRAHMERSSEMADRLRTSTAEETGARISDVAEFDLVLAHLRVPETV